MRHKVLIAEDESTSEALGDAIKSMLGLDLVERVIADTKVVEMRLAEEHARSAAPRGRRLREDAARRDRQHVPDVLGDRMPANRGA